MEVSTRSPKAIVAASAGLAAALVLVIGISLAQPNKSVESGRTIGGSNPPSNVTVDEPVEENPDSEESKPDTSDIDTLESEPTEPETTEPEQTKPEVTEPDTAATVETEPRDTAPEVTEPTVLIGNDAVPPGPGSISRSLSCGNAEGYVHYTKSGDSISIYQWDVKVRGAESASTVLRAYGPSGYEKFLDSTTISGDGWLGRRTSASVARNGEEPSFPGLAIDVNHNGTTCTMFTNPWLS